MTPLRTVLASAALAVALGGCAGALSTAGGATASAPPPPSGAGVAGARCHARGSGLFVLPDGRCTPGAIDRRVTQANVRATICRRGYTRRVRPPESVTEPQKLASMAAYGDRGSPRRYELDHLVALELGGAPDDPRNLWPEPGAGPNPKDRLEDALHRQVCRGQITLAAARADLAGDWVAAYRRAFG